MILLKCTKLAEVSFFKIRQILCHRAVTCDIVEMILQLCWFYGYPLPRALRMDIFTNKMEAVELPRYQSDPLTFFSFKMLVFARRKEHLIAV